MQDVVIKIKGDTSDLVRLGNELKNLGNIDAKNQKQFEETNKKHQEEVKDTKDEYSKLNETIKNAKGAIIAAFTIQAVMDFGKQVIAITSEFQKLKAVLNNTLGEQGGKKAFADIQKFAAQTPFSVAQITGSFVKLANQGFVPTIDQMTKLGDLASAMGKDFDMLAEAVIDAQVGEFERLKEFGVRASKSGDQVTFTFKGVSTTVKNTSKDIQNYVMSLGDIQGVAGGMAKVSETLGGKISNLGDSWDRFLYAIGEAAAPVISGVVSALGGFLDMLSGIFGTSDDAVASLQQEQIAFQELELQLNSVNPKSQERIEIIKTMQEKYPGFLANVDAEKVTNEQLEKALKKVNDEYVVKIALKQNEKKIDEAGAIAAEKGNIAATKRNKLNDEYRKLVMVQSVEARKYNQELVKGLPLEVAVDEVLNGRIELMRSTSSKFGRESLVQLQEARTEYKNAAIELSSAQKTLYDTQAAAQKDAAAMVEMFNVNLEDLNKTTDKEAEVTDKATKAHKEKKKAIEDETNSLQENYAEQNKIRKQQEETLKEALKIVEDIKNAGKITEDARKRIRNLIAQQSGDAKQIENERYTTEIENINDRYAKEIKAVEDAGMDAAKLKEAQYIELEFAAQNHQDKLNEISKKGSEVRKMTAYEEIMAVSRTLIDSGQTIVNSLNLQGEQAKSAQKGFALANLAFSTAEAIANIVKGATASSAQVAAASGPLAPITGPAAYASFMGQLVTVFANLLQAKQIIMGYKDGTASLKRNGNPAGVDTIPIMANEGEAIIPTDKNRQKPGLAAAWIKGNLDDYINVNYVIPALKRNKIDKDEAFASRIGKAISMSASFNDMNLLQSDKENRRILRSIDKTLKSGSMGLSRRKF